MQRRSAKNRHSNARTPAETKIRELSGRKSPQKRAIRRRAGNVQFAETGWWRMQSRETGLQSISGNFSRIRAQNRLWAVRDRSAFGNSPVLSDTLSGQKPLSCYCAEQ